MPHPDLSRFLLPFGREVGQAVEGFHGSHWYASDPHMAEATPDPPQEWSAYAGHCRSYNAWRSNFRVVPRKGSLMLTEPWDGEDA